MPGRLHGQVLADEIKVRWPGTKVVFMSGYTKTAVVGPTQLDAGVSLLSKPFRKNDLAQILRRTLDTV